MDRLVELEQHDLFINGKHVPAAGGAYSTDLDPATEMPIARVAQGGKEDVDFAVAAARAALPVWGGLRAAERGRILQRAAALLEQHQEELIELESLDAGKPLAGVRRQDLASVIDTVRYYAGWCDKITGQVIPTRPNALTYTIREPVGVVAAIVPWNFPLMIGMWKIAPALAGARVGDRGYFVEPTVFANVDHDMRISQEEIFGPVLSVIPFEDEEDALRIANGTAYSLAAGVWSADIGRVHRMATGMKAGTVWINTYGYTDVRLPWGGSGESGVGREHGDSALENFTEPKAIWLALDQ
jgi:acyl-CoA reductase-like NAD-dependent aldehyde dehydrogenase